MIYFITDGEFVKIGYTARNGEMMDKIRIGDKLQKSDAILTITDIYLFRLSPTNNLQSVVIYDLYNVDTKKLVEGCRTYSVNWEGWENVSDN